jgi:hypothetical protein
MLNPKLQARADHAVKKDCMRVLANVPNFDRMTFVFEFSVHFASCASIV